MGAGELVLIIQYKAEPANSNCAWLYYNEALTMLSVDAAATISEIEKVKHFNNA